MILEALGAVGTLAAVVSLLFAANALGRRSERGIGAGWRENFDASEASHGITKEKLAAETALRLAADQANVALRETMDGMSVRLARLDEERKEFGGSKTYDATIEVLGELKKMNEIMRGLPAVLADIRDGNGKDH